MKTYKAWARRMGSNSQFVTTEIKANTMKEARVKFAKYELDSKPYKSN